MHVFIYACMYVCIGSYICIQVYTGNTHIYESAQMHRCTYAHGYINICTSIHICIPLWMSLWIPLWAPFWMPLVDPLWIPLWMSFWIPFWMSFWFPLLHPIFGFRAEFQFCIPFSDSVLDSEFGFHFWIPFLDAILDSKLRGQRRGNGGATAGPRRGHGGAAPDGRVPVTAP